MCYAVLKERQHLLVIFLQISSSPQLKQSKQRYNGSSRRFCAMVTSYCDFVVFVVVRSLQCQIFTSCEKTLINPIQAGGGTLQVF